MISLEIGLMMMLDDYGRTVSKVEAFDLDRRPFRRSVGTSESRCSARDYGWEDPSHGVALAFWRDFGACVIAVALCGVSAPVR